VNVEELLSRARLDYPALARLSGLSEGYIRQLSAGNRNAGPQSRAKLAAALRAHGATLATLADELDRTR
jgi:transcriptional regulator with XRE-family HTH domain